MIFLLAKILLLLVLAALLGAWLAHWWLRRQYVDVTREFARLDGEWLTWRQAVTEKMRHPLVDLVPMQDRLARLESSIHAIDIPKPATTDLGPVMSAIASIEIPPPKAVDFTPLLSRIEGLESAVAAIHIPTPVAMDLQPVLDKLALLEARTAVPPAATSPSTDRLVRAGSRNLLTHAAYGQADDLQRIKGVKSVLEQMLHGIGVFYFWQIAEWTAQDAAHADAQLPAFHGRIERDHWIAQATQFAAGDGAVRKL